MNATRGSMSLNHSPELYGFSDVFWGFYFLFMANLNPRSMVGKIYIGNHFAYKRSCGSHDF